MSNIFLKKNNHRNAKNTTEISPVKEYINAMEYEKHFPVTSKEWSNNVYSYNKNSVKLLPSYDKLIIKLIKSYFNFYDPLSIDQEKKVSNRINIKKKRLSTNRIFVSKAELKHTNSSVIATLYTYNAQETYLIRKLNKINPIFKITSESFFKWIKQIKHQVAKEIDTINKNNILQYKPIEKNFIGNFKEIFISKLNYNNLYKNFVKKYLIKQMLTVKYKRLLYLNKSKFENTRLLVLNKLINKIYGKKIELNIINLRYLHLNSDILSQAIAIKLKNRKNKLLKVLTKAVKLVKLPILINKLSASGNAYETNNIFLLNKVRTSNLKPIFTSSVSDNKDILDQVLQEVFSKTQEKNKNSNNIENIVINDLKYKPISGVRLESSGRLTRRFTAARSLFKFKYKGSLKNIDSSNRGLSSAILRGHVKSNIQYTKISSKNRNGSFGIKGWVSSS